MNTAYRLILIVLFGAFMATCQKEISAENGTVIPPPVNPPVTITASVSGRIINELGDPVQGATVKTGTSFTTTDINGEFKLTNVQMSDKAAYVTVTKSGYFEGSRTFMARQGQKHFVEIQLVPKMEVGSINATSGGTISIGNGSAITLPANGVVVQSSGAAYTGAVKVSMAWIDPTSSDLFRQMPGDLRGTDANNNEVGMESYGMIGVELNGAAGEKLQIATGKKATLKFPLPSSIQGTAPATIALWSFDETKGLWKQEGTATKSGSAYIADVSHFSWWNCDFPINTSAYFSATITAPNGQPLPGVHIHIYRQNGSYSGAHGYTDSSGYIIGRVPANEVLTIKVDGPYPCYGVLATQTIGPFTVNSTNNLGNVTLNTSAMPVVTLTGTAQNCSGAAVTNGFIEVHSGFGTFRQNITNGSFSISFIKCATGDVEYFIVDNAASQQSAPVSVAVNPGNNNLGTVSACGISTIEFIDYSVDGQSVSLTKNDSLFAFGQGTTMTYVNGSNIASGNHISFAFAGSSPGTFPLKDFSANIGLNSYSFSQAQVSAVNTVITGFGMYVAGSFSGVIVDSSSVSHPVQCNFRVRKY